MSVYHQNIPQHFLPFWHLHFEYDTRLCNNIFVSQTCLRFRSVWASIIVTLPSFSDLVKPAHTASFFIVLHRFQWSQQKLNLPCQYQIADLSFIEEFSALRTWYNNSHTAFYSEILSISLTTVQHDQIKCFSVDHITPLSVF